MVVSFDINTYDLLQRSISTAEALEELGAAEAEAAFEAAESVFEERNDRIDQLAYIIEYIVASGPPVGKELVVEYMNRRESDSAEIVIEHLAVSVLGSATYSDAFDNSPSETLGTEKEPQESYDANPKQILELFGGKAEEFAAANATSTDYESIAVEASENIVEQYSAKLQQLSFTALCIVCHHIAETYEVEPELSDMSTELETGSLNTVGQYVFAVYLAEYLTEELGV